MSKKNPNKKKSLLGRHIRRFLLMLVGWLILLKIAFAGKIGISSVVSRSIARDIGGYTNIALFGVDSREKELEKSTRSDTMIIASINNQTGEVRMVSVYRDTYLDVGNGVFTKCNAAYAKGGPEQAIAMLNSNLDLNITDFVTVGFGGLTQVINDVGGITLDIQPEEIRPLNDYQISMVGTSSDGIHFTAQEGKDYTPITQAGEQLCNGLQATAYCRIRYTAGNDFRRTQRQRTVINLTAQAIKKAGPLRWVQVGNDIREWTYTSLDTGDMLGLMTKAMRYHIGETTGFPFPDKVATGHVGRSGSCVIPVNLVTNVQQLHAFLFGEQNYTPTQTVQNNSARISRDTGH